MAEELDSMREDLQELKEICWKTYRKLFETNGGPSVLDRLSRVEDAQKLFDEHRKWRMGIYAAVIGCIAVQALSTLAPLIAKVLAVKP